MKSAEDLEKEWWDRWWEQDWSWDGPRFRSVAGKKNVVREFWAREADDVCVMPSDGAESKLYTDPTTGKVYTRFHLPLTWSDRKTPTPKATWTREDHQLISEQLTRIVISYQRNDQEADLRGAVLKSFPELPKASDFDRDTHPDNLPSIRLTHAWIELELEWKGRVFSDLILDHSCIHRGASFSKSIFLGRVSLDETLVTGSIGFDDSYFYGRTYFDYTIFCDRVSFSKSNFDHEAHFVGSQFFNGFDFRSAIFLDDALFTSCAIYREALFEEATFTRKAWFKDTRFLPGEGGIGRMSFRRALVKEEFDFRIAELPSDPSFSISAFAGTKFARRPDFDTDQFFSPAAFADVILDNGIDLYREYIDPINQTTPSVMEKYVKRVCEEDPQIRDKLLRSVASGARALQKVMADARHNDAEQLFHRLEVIARRARLPWYSLRRPITFLYQWTSDFGGSIGRPLFSLLIVWFICSACYWTIYTGVDSSCLDYKDKTPCAWVMEVEGESSWADAFTFSSTATFRPFYVWTLNNERSGGAFADKLLFGDQDADAKTGAREFWVKFLATAQSLFSIVMLFLSGLAARRYYQVS